MSDWLVALRDACASAGQARAARRIGYSAAVVSQVLSGSYAGDMNAVRKAVEGALMGGRVECPALGQDIGTDQCIAFQRRPLAATTPARVRLYRTCPTCPHNRHARLSVSSQTASHEVKRKENRHAQ